MIPIILTIIIINIYCLWKYRQKINIYKKYKLPLYKVSFAHSYSKFQIPVIKMQIKDTMAYFILDTGSNSNIINSSYEETIRLFTKSDFTQSTEIFGLAGSKKVHKVKGSLKYGKITFKDLEFNIVDINEPLKILNTDFKGKIIGILGAEFMHQYNIHLDFETLCVWIKV